MSYKDYLMANWEEKNKKHDRISEDWKKHFKIPEDGINPYTGIPTNEPVLCLTKDQLNHIISLDNRCRELYKSLTDDLKTIKNDIKKHIAEGSKAYPATNIEGCIYWESDCENEALEHLYSEHAEHGIHVVNVDSERSVERLNEDREIELFGNWCGKFRTLYNEKESKGIKLTRAFRMLFDESDIFTLEDLLNVRPDEINQHIQIFI